MSDPLILCLIAGITVYIIGLCMTLRTEEELYCEELGYKGNLKQWKKYAQSLTSSKPMQKELMLMNKERFIAEMYLVYKLTLMDA